MSLPPRASRATFGASPLLSLVVLAAFACTLLVAADAHACPVCGTAKAPNDWAFGLTTIVLSVMPPMLMAGLVFLLVRAHRKAAREDSELSELSTPE